MLETLPDTPERTQHELDCSSPWAAPLRVTKAAAAPEVEQAYARARELCQQVGDTPQLFEVLHGLCAVLHAAGGSSRRPRELGEQLLSLAQRVQDPALLLGGSLGLGGDLVVPARRAPRAHAHLEQGMALSQQHAHPGPRLRTRALGVDCLCVERLVLWQLGYPDQALQCSHEALTLAQTLSHPYQSGGRSSAYSSCPSPPPGGTGRARSGQRRR